MSGYTAKPKKKKDEKKQKKQQQNVVNDVWKNGGEVYFDINNCDSNDTTLLLARQLVSIFHVLDLHECNSTGIMPAMYLSGVILEKFESEKKKVMLVRQWREMCIDVLVNETGCSDSRECFENLLDENFDDNYEHEINISTINVLNVLVKHGCFIVGDEIFACGDLVLSELPIQYGGDWCLAVIENVINSTEGEKMEILFLEWGLKVLVCKEDVRKFDNIVDDDVDISSLKEGVCEMCERTKLLTFHHLIPKDVHSRYENKKWPADLFSIAEQFYDKQLEKSNNVIFTPKQGVWCAKPTPNTPSKEFLNTWGVSVCRQCHSQIHRLETNEDLAATFNTLQSLLQHDGLQKWIGWAKNQNVHKKSK